jgi:ParB family chromosome partitioning protein
MKQQKTRIIDKRIGFKVLRLEQVVLAPNYRTNFSITDITPLAESMREVGQLQPVIINQVRRADELVAGQRRYYALVHAGIKDIKCIVYESLTQEEIAKIQLSENIKQPIGSIGRAESIPRAQDMVEKLEGRVLSKAAFADKINVSRTTVKEAHYYANLYAEARRAVEEAKITYTIGVQIGRLEKAKQEPLLIRVLRGDFKNAKELGVYVSGLKKTLEAPSELELAVQETDKEYYAREKAKDYFESLKQAASYLQSLFLLLEKGKDTRQIIANATLNHLALGGLVQSISIKLGNLEEKIMAHNNEALEEALHPKKKKHILALILKERKINHGGQTAADLIKNAKEAEIKLDRIYRDKNQPRKTNTPEYKEYIRTLGENIKEMGVLTPIILVKRKTSEGEYRVVVGESRWRAAKKAGLNKIPAFITQLDDLSCYIVQLAEDLHRKDSPIERAQAISTLAEEKKKLGTYSREEFRMDMEAFMGMKPAEVRKYMNFLELDSRTKQLVYNKTLSFSSALELGRIKEHNQRRELANMIIAQNLGAQNAKKLISETIQNIKWYSHVQGKEKEFLEQCTNICQGLAESKIICEAIKCLAGIDSKLTKLPTEEKFYKDDRLATSYALFKKAIDNYNQLMSKK